MFGKKKAVAAPAPVDEKKMLHDKAMEYINSSIDRMAQSSNWDMFYGMLCLAFDLGIISYEERQALDKKNRDKAAELREQEKLKAKADKEKRDRIIAEYKAERAAKAKAEKAKMQEGAK